jgi:hypothetical protein
MVNHYSAGRPNLYLLRPGMQPDLLLSIRHAGLGGYRDWLCSGSIFEAPLGNKESHITAQYTLHDHF